MKLLVIGAGMMGSAAAFDMGRQPDVESVTLADADLATARRAAFRVNRLLRAGGRTRAVLTHARIVAVRLDARDRKAAARLMRGHAATLSAVPYFFNLGLCRAAIAAGCHFADLGGNNTVVRQEYALAPRAAKRGIAIAPDCGLSPGMASVLAGELVRRLETTHGKKPRGRLADALKIYVGGLPRHPKPPFSYQLVFSVEGLINEYAEPASILRDGKMVAIEPLTELENFPMEGFGTLEAFHTSGGTSTMPETFRGRVGECFEKTLRYPGHFAMVRSLYDLGFFGKEKMRMGAARVSPRQVTARLFIDQLSSAEPDVCIMRVEAHRGRRVTSFSMVDYFDPATGMTAMMRTTAWPASIVVMMMARGVIAKRGGIHQETDVPGQMFLDEMGRRGVEIRFRKSAISSRQVLGPALDANKKLRSG